jgi:hypothetical protein
MAAAVEVPRQAQTPPAVAPKPAPSKSSPPAEQASASAASSPQSSEVSAPAEGWQIDVSATEKTWLSIVSNGKRLFSGVLEPSESKTLQGKESARLLVGNAGGIEVYWNGRLIGPLGGRGQVRAIVFTRDNYRILPADEM